MGRRVSDEEKQERAAAKAAAAEEKRERSAARAVATEQKRESAHAKPRTLQERNQSVSANQMQRQSDVERKEDVSHMQSSTCSECVKNTIQQEWPKEVHAAGNAGVMLIGHSAKHGGVPAVVLGGRFYTGKKTYAYTDFGGGVDKKNGETVQQGAFREFAEELLSLDEKAAKSTAERLCVATTSALVGGRPFIHKNYAIFIVPAEAVDKVVLPFEHGGSAIDRFFELAERNSELTSVALVSIDELIRGASCDGKVYPLSVRQLDEQLRTSDEIFLRGLMVGMSGSIHTITDTLEAFANTPSNVNEATRREASNAKHSIPLPSKPIEMPGQLYDCEAASSETEGVDAVAEMSRDAEGLQTLAAKKRRWGRATDAQDCTGVQTIGTNALPSASSKAASRSTSNWRKGQKLSPYVFDMETGDPDDVLTLLFLGSHPAVELRAVTITPGSREQVELVRWILQKLGLTHVRLGAQGWPANANKPVQLNTRFYKSFGRAPHGEPACEEAARILLECCDESVTLVTGAPLHNLGDVLRMDGFRLGRWVAQGGFAGEGVVPAEEQMDKFKGQDTCPTWNFCGNIPAAQAALASTAISRKICVSKNVCHAVYYDQEWHKALGSAAELVREDLPKGRRAVAFGMMYDAMDDYLRHKPGGKKLHDPLALAVALDESVCDLAEVELYCCKGYWGSRLSPGSNIWISVAYNAAKFQTTLLH